MRPVNSDPAAVEHRLAKALARGVTDFSMLEDGDRVMVCVSGGKDSYTMLYLLRELAKKAPIRFSLKVVNVDQNHPKYPTQTLTDYMEREGYDFSMVAEDTYSIVKEKIPEGKTFCSLCSRLRRGILYRLAREYGCTKIALGHHRDDVLQTLLLNLFFAGKLGAMPPKLISGEGQVVIRPLVFASETDIELFAGHKQFPILPCDLCGSQDNLQRKVVGRLLDDLEAKHPGIKQVMLSAVSNVRPSHLLDRGLWSALGLSAAEEGGTEGGSFVPAERLFRAVSVSPIAQVPGEDV
jgi:tRNA 2-thiocytidine biosynthesis protein TtcA